MNFMRRSYQAELIDDPAIPFPEIQQNLRELDMINTWLGGHAISIKGLKRILTHFRGAGDKHWQICEIGCGGGDNMHALASWCVGHKINAGFTGVDINQHCIEYASRKTYPRPV